MTPARERADEAERMSDGVRLVADLDAAAEHGRHDHLRQALRLSTAMSFSGSVESIVASALGAVDERDADARRPVDDVEAPSGSCRSR